MPAPLVVKGHVDQCCSSPLNQTYSTGEKEKAVSPKSRVSVIRPFQLSRSNSRRSKELLSKEKAGREKRQESVKADQLSFKASPIPTTNYISRMVVKKSTKDLTLFNEFAFNRSLPFFSQSTRNTTLSSISTQSRGVMI